jgi:hypothetical protein
LRSMVRRVRHRIDIRMVQGAGTLLRRSFGRRNNGAFVTVSMALVRISTIIGDGTSITGTSTVIRTFFDPCDGTTRAVFGVDTMSEFAI